MTKSTPPALMHKSLPVSGINVIDDEKGIVEAFVSGIGNKDSVADIIQPGAFDDSLKIRKPKGVWSHDWDRPVSKTLEIYEVPAGDPRLPLKMQLAGIGGLFVKTQFNLNTQTGRDAYENVKFFEEEAEWSIGYQVTEGEYDKKQKAMLLHKIDLYEYSPVLFGANSLTATVSVKAHKGSDGEIEYKIEGLDEMQTKAVEAALEVVLKSNAIELEEDVDTKVDATIEEDAEMASETQPAEGEKTYSVLNVNDTFHVVDSKTTEVVATFVDEEKANEKAEELNTPEVEDVETKDEDVESDVESDAEVVEEAEEEDSDDEESEEEDSEDDVEVVEEEKSEDDDVETKSVEDEVDVKVGRSLSTKNRSSLEKAIEAIQAVLEGDKTDAESETEEKEDDSEVETKEDEIETEEKSDDVEVETPETSEKPAEVKYITGSIEEAARNIANGVKEAAEDQLRSASGASEYFYAWASGTFSDHVIYEVESDAGCSSYKVSFTTENGEFVINDVTEVEVETEITQTVTEKGEDDETETKDDDTDVETKDEDAEVETKEDDEEVVEEKEEDVADVDDASFLQGLAEFEEILDEA